MRIIDQMKNRKCIIILIIPLLIVAQYYLFKFGILRPMIKGVEINIINGDYIQDIDKYVIRLGEEVTLSSGEYIKIPQYAKDPEISFKVLDDNKILKIIDSNEKEPNTATLIGLKKGYSSIAIVKNSRVLKKATVLVVDPKVESLDLNVDGNLVFVGDRAEIGSNVEVDYKRFKDSYKVIYESSNEDIIKIEGNQVKAVGVGNATIYAKSGDKVDSIRYRISAKVSSMKVDKSIEIEVGESKKIVPKITTSPRGLKHPSVEYQLVESKLPIERAIRLDQNGVIVGLREGEEKVLISCGIGSNKKSQIVTVKVAKESLLKKSIKDLISTYKIVDNKLLITLTWSSMEEIYNYDVYLRDNLSDDKKYNAVRSIIMDKIDLDSKNKIRANLEIDLDNIHKADFDIYVVGVTDKGNTNKSNIVNVKHSIEDIENESINLSANLDKDNKNIYLSWDTIENARYNIYVKDISKGSQSFVLYAEGISENSYNLNLEGEDLNLEVYVSAIIEGKDEVKSAIKVFK
ncbi:hypothetical protein EAI30_03790 [Romboutsia ilealis]|uniref:BIG2 domain-containing protein n=1 Tax=Romboutsia faecis TaxID=2764597 RepID=A0ABR7JKT7_9FIRM|nr:hypothetical protein [Romboutsia faecis]MBC5995535.1 hypothetical protein [Romboutsia faecis]MRN23735.1 hypothetical protein [Romboutsia ilealis]